MGLFMMTCVDKPNALALRMATRETHLAYMGQFGDRIRLGGPMLSETGEMRGSLIILEAKDLAEAKAINAADPYTLAGLFERVEITAWRRTVGVEL